MNIKKQIDNLSQNDDEEIEEIRGDEKRERYQLDPHMWVHSANRIPFGARLKYLILSAILIAYGFFGISKGGIYFPGKRGPGVYFIGLTMWILFAAMLSAAIHMLSVLIDHYDRRNNEAAYRKLAAFSFWISLVLLILTFIVGAVNNDFR